MWNIKPIYDGLLGEVVFHHHPEITPGPTPVPPSPIISVIVSPLSGIVDSFPLSAADGAEWDYTVSNGCKKRVGEVLSIWNIAGDINNTDTGALDIPESTSTSAVSFQTAVSGSYINLIALVEAGGGTWQITVERDLISSTPDPNDYYEVFVTGYIVPPYSVIDSVPISAGDGAEWEMVISNNGSKRISEIQAVWNISGAMSFAEVGAIDVPDPSSTSAITLSAWVSGSYAQLIGISTSGSWFYRAERETL